MKSVHFFPFIVQEAFFPNILLLLWLSAGAHHLVGIPCFLDSLEAWEAKNTKHSLVPTSCHISVFKKLRLDNLLFKQGAPYHKMGSFEASHIPRSGVHFPRFCNFACLLIKTEKNCIHQEKQSLPGTLHHFLAPLDNIEQNSSFLI